MNQVFMVNTWHGFFLSMFYMRALLYFSFVYTAGPLFSGDSSADHLCAHSLSEQQERAVSSGFLSSDAVCFFDDFFPRSPLSTVLSSCMKVYGRLLFMRDFHLQQENVLTDLCKDVSAFQKSVFDELLAGRLDFRTCLEDIEYLLAVLEKMGRVCEALPAELRACDALVQVEKAVSQIREVLNQIMDSVFIP